MLQVAKKIASCNASSSVDRMNTNSKTSTFGTGCNNKMHKFEN